MKLLHVVATPRGDSSHTLPIARAYIDALLEARPDTEVEEVDLFTLDLPAIAGTNIRAKYMLMTGQPLDDEARESWADIERMNRHFLAADSYLLSVPMWNFTVPYVLKYYIDCIVQPGYAFRVEATGVAPLVLDRRMVCITSRGSDYSPGSPYEPYDFLEPYLRAIFGFIGITDIDFVNAQPMDYGPDLRAAAAAAATVSAQALARRPELEVA
jgi:FMN-dependent NADH-azoreductase